MDSATRPRTPHLAPLAALLVFVGAAMLVVIAVRGLIAAVGMHAFMTRGVSEPSLSGTPPEPK